MATSDDLIAAEEAKRGTFSKAYGWSSDAKTIAAAKKLEKKRKAGIAVTGGEMDKYAQRALSGLLRSDTPPVPLSKLLSFKR